MSSGCYGDTAAWVLRNGLDGVYVHFGIYQNFAVMYSFGRGAKKIL